MDAKSRQTIASVAFVPSAFSTGTAASRSSASKRLKNVTSEPTAVQIIHNTQGKPAYVVIPYEHYV
ncbi:hypothetical protein NL341_26390, partial [Klebsiella pneumoniae]|nr:hypothetical protein [Klebsiella pneumoniae]